MSAEQTLLEEMQEALKWGGTARADKCFKKAMAKIDELERQVFHLQESMAACLDDNRRLQSETIEAQKDQADKARLDFIMENDAFIVWALFDRTFKRCYLMTQDEDEEYRRLSGEGKSFDTPRQAIDAAIQKVKP